jgi:alkylated DNA repair dioxygenase AlkB
VERMRVRKVTSASELPEGFTYHPGVLLENEQRDLIQTVEQLPFQPFEFQGYTAKRRIVEYGFEYDFSTRKTATATPIPDYLLPIRNRAAALAGVCAEEVVEAVVTEYPPGAPIGWHRDVPQFEIIIGISLASSCRMRLKPYKAEGKLVSVILEPGSAYVMRDTARWKYQHSIAPVEKLRYSITFRTLRAKRTASPGSS